MKSLKKLSYLNVINDTAPTNRTTNRLKYLNSSLICICICDGIATYCKLHVYSNMWPNQVISTEITLKQPLLVTISVTVKCPGQMIAKNIFHVLTYSDLLLSLVKLKSNYFENRKQSSKSFRKYPYAITSTEWTNKIRFPRTKYSTSAMRTNEIKD